MRWARPGRGRGRAASRGAPPPALAAAALAACVGPLGRLAQAQECATVNVYDQGNNSPPEFDTCAELLADGSELSCEADFAKDGQYQGL